MRWNCHVYLLTVTGCSACSILSDAANERCSLGRSTTAVYRRKRRFGYNQLACACFVGGKAACECQWPWISSRGLLNFICEWKVLGIWKKGYGSKWRFKNIIFLYTYCSEAKRTGFSRHFRSLRGADICRRVVASFPCILYNPFSLSLSRYSHLSCWMASGEGNCWFKLHTIRIRILNTS
jgi:hypothetical protein